MPEERGKNSFFHLKHFHTLHIINVVKFLWRGELKLPVDALCVLFATLIVCVLLLVPFGAFAQETPSSETQELEFTAGQTTDPITAAELALPLGEDGTGVAQPVPAVSVLSIFRVILTLAVVAVAIYGIVYFIKRAWRGTATQDPFLKILASTTLGQNRSAHIISVGSRAWLVGAAENGVHLISEIEDKDILNAMFLEDSRKSAEAPTGPLPDFKAMLRKLGMPVESETPSPENIRQRSERLKGL